MSVINNVERAWRSRVALLAMLRFGCTAFSHFGEDRIYDRLLKPGRGGTYVDVGAHHPVLGSNTFALYAKGWTGLTVDPNPKFAPMFRKHRPRDTHLAEGVSLSPDNLTYYEFGLDWHNTFDPGVVAQLEAEGRAVQGTRSIRCRPLHEMIEAHLGGRQIDLLNVDCEGFDLDVLESLDIQRYRPTTIIVEEFERYWSFQQRGEPAPLESYLRRHGYLPIAQSVWSGIYVAEDWRELMKLSPGFDEHKASLGGYMPGQQPAVQQAA